MDAMLKLIKEIDDVGAENQDAIAWRAKSAKQRSNEDDPTSIRST